MHYSFTSQDALCQDVELYFSKNYVQFVRGLLSLNYLKINSLNPTITLFRRSRKTFAGFPFSLRCLPQKEEIRGLDNWHISSLIC